MIFKTVNELRQILDECERYWSEDDERIYGSFGDQVLFIDGAELTIEYISNLKLVIKKHEDTQ